MRGEVERVAARRGLSLPQAPVRVGTDCSGLDAPVFALKAISLRHGMKHVFSCEVDARKLKFLTANSPEAILYGDMLRRKHESVPAHDLYVCGFRASRARGCA